MKEAKIKNLLPILTICLIAFLIIIIVIFYFKNEAIEDKYEELEERYEYLYENNKSNEQQNEDINFLSQNEALDIVLKNLNITKDKISDLDIELEYKARFSSQVYEISFNYKYLEYEYYLDPVTGKILDSLKSIN